MGAHQRLEYAAVSRQPQVKQLMHDHVVLKALILLREIAARFGREMREFKSFERGSLKTGDSISVDMFAPGDKVTITGTSKGKGFQGVMRRHGFGGVGGTTHGQSDRLRAPGSIGSSSYPSRVFRGMRMAGRMGSARVTYKNLKVVRVIPESNVLIVKGSVPGAKQGLLEIHKQS